MLFLSLTGQRTRLKIWNRFIDTNNGIVYGANMKLKKLTAIVFFLSCLIATFDVLAESCEIKSEKDGFITLLCHGKIYRAFSQQDFEAMLAEKKQLVSDRTQLKEQLKETGNLASELKKVTEKYKKLNGDYEELNNKYNSSLDESIKLNDKFKNESVKLVGISERYDKLGKDYDELCGKYRKIAINGSSNIRFDLGAGLTSGDGDIKGAALVGADFSIVHVWAFLQKQNSGGFIGKSINF